MRVLIRLLATAIGNASPVLNGTELQLFLSYNIDQWKALLKLAERNNVISTAILGLQKTALANPSLDIAIMRPEYKHDRLEYSHSILMLEQQCKEKKNALKDLAGFFSCNKIRTLILKGYSLDLLYPEQNYRYSSDIDIYLYGDAARADRLLAEKRHIQTNSDNDKHSYFLYNGIAVENHYLFLNTERIPKLRIVQERLEQLAVLAAADPQTGCLLPPAQFNAIFLPYHFAMHFVFRGAMLVHLLDWALFLNAQAANVDWDEVTDLAGRTGLLGFLGLLNHIAVNDFGCTVQGLPDIPVPPRSVEWFYRELGRELPKRNEEKWNDTIHKHIVWCKRYRNTYKSSYLSYFFRTFRQNKTN